MDALLHVLGAAAESSAQPMFSFMSGGSGTPTSKPQTLSGGYNYHEGGSSSSTSVLAGGSGGASDYNMMNAYSALLEDISSSIPSLLPTPTSWDESMWFRLLLLCTVEAIGVNRLWGERVHRRCLHHVEKNVFNPSKRPFIRSLREFGPVVKHLKILHNLDLRYGDRVAGGGNQWSIICKLSVAQYSPRATIYYDSMNEETREIVDRIGSAVAEDLSSSNLLGERIQLAPKSSSFRACILRYEGADAEFPWHYDTEHPSCYRALFLFHKEGSISPLQYLDSDKQLHTLRLAVGDGWVFKGTTTLHRVPRNTDPNSKRYMIGFQFTRASRDKQTTIRSSTSSNVDSALEEAGQDVDEDDNAVDDEEEVIIPDEEEEEVNPEHISICSMLRQAKPAHILWEFLPGFFLCWFTVLCGHTSWLGDALFHKWIGEASAQYLRRTFFAASCGMLLLSTFLPGLLATRFFVGEGYSSEGEKIEDENDTKNKTMTSASAATSSEELSEVDEEVGRSSRSRKKTLVVQGAGSSDDDEEKAKGAIAAELAGEQARGQLLSRTPSSDNEFEKEQLRPTLSTTSTTASASTASLASYNFPCSRTTSVAASGDADSSCDGMLVQERASFASVEKMEDDCSLSGIGDSNGRSTEERAVQVKRSMEMTQQADGDVVEHAVKGKRRRLQETERRPWIGTGMNKSSGTIARLYLGCILSALDFQTGFYFMAYLLATEMLLPNTFVGYV
ncbi:unnamed protein product [Amoebophrya sp. A25]|nr:unnamed protein product [Amoebophrya sp. A25]|eukprot:GSA25T00014657001.1